MLDYLRESADERAIRREHTKREKERRKRRIHKYGQMELKHSRRGCVSCMLAVLSAFLLISIFSVSYLRHGNVNILIGIAGLLALVLAVSGLRRGIEGFKERNKNYITCKVGTACNGILLLIYLAIFIRGLF